MPKEEKLQRYLSPQKLKTRVYTSKARGKKGDQKLDIVKSLNKKKPRQKYIKMLPVAVSE